MYEVRDTAESRSQLQSLPRSIRARGWRFLKGWSVGLLWAVPSHYAGRSRERTAFGRVIGECFSRSMSRPGASPYSASPTGGMFTTI